MKQKIYIRTDASFEIGMGHLIRCIAFAQMLVDKYDIFFFCLYIPDESIKEINNLNFFIRKIESEKDFIESLNPEIIVVLDGYNFDLTYQRQVKNFGSKLILIDDYIHDEYIADLVINHAPIDQSRILTNFSKTIFAFGLDYALLRPNFLKAARVNLKHSKEFDISICFGGGDFKNLTVKTLNILKESQLFNKIAIITGPAYNFKSDLKNVINKNDSIKHFNAIDASKICELFSNSNFVIVPASGILYEAIAIGSKVISGYYTDNQLSIYKGFLSQNGFIDAFDFSEAYLNKALITIEDFVPARLIDGRSNYKLLDKVNSLSSV